MSVAPAQLYQMLTAAGLPPTAAAAFVSIAGRESGFNPGAHNGNAGTGDDSYGLFQINLLNGGWTSFLQAHGMQDPRSALTTPQGAVQAAAWIYASSGMNPWGGYKGNAWSYGTNLATGVAASGGQVSLAQLQSFSPGGHGQGGIGGAAVTSGTAGPGVAGGDPIQATNPLPKFNLPAGGKLYAVDGTMVVEYMVGKDKIYYDFSEPGIGSRINTSNVVSGQPMTTQEFYNQPNLIHAGVVSELSGKDLQGSQSYQAWVQNYLNILSGGNKDMLNDPGVVSVMLQGAAQGWSGDEINAKLKLTNYWKTHTDSQKTWATKSPAEQQQETNNSAGSLRDAYFQATGLQINPNDPTLKAWAAKIASGANTITDATWNWLRPLAAKNPASPWSRQLESEKEQQRQPAIDIGNMIQTVQDQANTYGIKMANNTAFQWATNLVQKTKSNTDLTNLLKNQATVMYPWAKDQLNTGMTIKDVATPWVDTYNRTMEQQTDLFNPKVQAALTQGQPVYDFEKQLKADPAWLQTTNAHDTLTSAVAQVGQKMGFTQ